MQFLLLFSPPPPSLFREQIDPIADLSSVSIASTEFIAEDDVAASNVLVSLNDFPSNQLASVGLDVSACDEPSLQLCCEPSGGGEEPSATNVSEKKVDG